MHLIDICTHTHTHTHSREEYKIRSHLRIKLTSGGHPYMYLWETHISTLQQTNFLLDLLPDASCSFISPLQSQPLWSMLFFNCSKKRRDRFRRGSLATGKKCIKNEKKNLKEWPSHIAKFNFLLPYLWTLLKWSLLFWTQVTLQKSFFYCLGQKRP